MCKKIFFLIFAFLVFIVGAVLVIKFSNNDPKPEKIECKRPDGTHGICIERKMCADSTQHITERLSSDRDANCKSDNENDDDDVICCVDHLSDYSESVNETELKMKLLNDKKCGVISSNRIFGGEKADPGEFPFFVALKYRSENSSENFSFTCGGSLISGRNLWKCE